MKQKKHSLKTTVAALTLAALTIALAGCGQANVSSGNSATPTPASPSPSTSATATPEATPAASGGIRQGGELVAAYSTEPTTWDPYLSEGADVRSLLFNVYEGLVKPNSKGELVPAVAEAYTISPDATKYTFTLRKDIKFSDGRPVTTGDIKYSLDRARELQLSSALKSISEIEAVSDTEVVITLAAADVDFLPYLTLAILPEGVDLAAKPLGTGPFTLESYATEEEIVLVRNTNYWQEGRPYLDKVTLKKTADTDASLLALQAGTIDISSVTQTNYEQVDKSKFNFTQRKSASVQQFNLNNAKEPFTDERVRQAVSYVVNAQEIIDLVNGGLGFKSGTPIIPGLTVYYDESLEKSYPTDIEKAKALLSDAGYANGFTFDITVPSNYPVHVNTAQVIAQQLQQIGVTANIVQVDWATWLSQVYTNRDYTSTIISVDGSALSPRSFLSRYVSDASNNFVNYNSADFDKIYADAQKELDVTKRVALYKDLQKLLSEDAASVYIQDIQSYIALNSKFAGYEDYPLYVTDYSTIHLAE